MARHKEIALLQNIGLFFKTHECDECLKKQKEE
jgi:hypothetical protein